MITVHSIDLKKINSPCFALSKALKGCKVLIHTEEECCTYKCPFYKPDGCKDWVRIEDRTGINLIPPEEAFGRNRRK